MRRFPVCIFISFLLLACSNDKAGFASMEASNDDFYASGDEAQALQTTSREEAADMAIVGRKIIKNADFRMKVKKVDSSSKKIEDLVASHGGYINSKNLTNDSYQLSNRIVIKVPAEKFENLLEEIAKEAVFVNSNRVYSTDVTEEFIDIQTRLQTKKNVRDRYIDILRNKAKSVEDVLKAEEAIRVVQEEIESKEGRLKYLQNQIALSTINLEIYEEVEYRAEPAAYNKSFGKRILAGLGSGWELILSIFVGIAHIWPIVLLGGLLLWQRKRIFRRLRTTRSERSGSS